MSDIEATAEGFVNVLKALPRAQRDAVIVRIAQDREFQKDILDLAAIEQRRDEPSRSFRDYLAEKKKARR